MLSFTDQMDRIIHCSQSPKRIISLVPSQTELLFDLGAGEKVVGITKFCIHPAEWFRTKTRVGGTKQLDFEKIKILNPDLIIGNKEENEKMQIEALMHHYPVWMSDIKDLNDAMNMIKEVGNIINEKDKAQALVETIKNKFKQLEVFRTTKNKIRTAYIIWNNPIMSVNRDTFIDEMLSMCGFQNICIHENASRYPELTFEELKKLNPALILLSSEPFPFKEKHIAEFKQACPQAVIKLVDGEFFSWYGSRLQHAPSYFLSLIVSLKDQLPSQA